MNVFHERASQIALYTPAASKNGTSIAILLELLRQPHSVHLVENASEIADIDAKKATELPLITDLIGSGIKNVVQRADISKYLFSRYDEGHEFSYAEGSHEDSEVNSWLSFLSRTIGHVEDSDETPFARKALTLYLYLEEHLQKAQAPYIVGHKCTLADIAILPYAAVAGLVGLDLERFPEVTAWYNRLTEIPGVRRGMDAVHLKG